jgi:lysophospholipase L1-like esterase
MFDLARVESVRPDGTPERFGMGGRQYEQLAAALTSDGGHLNQAGSVAAARELVHVLAGVLAARATADAGAPLRRSLAP